MANSVLQKIQQTREQLGSAVLNSLYPEDFEYYLVALELYEISGSNLESRDTTLSITRDSKFGTSQPKKIVDSLIFPINPSSLSEGFDSKVNIKRTSGGVVSLNNETFKPIAINLSGSFGRRFKLMIKADDTSYKKFINTVNADSVEGFKNQFGQLVKSFDVSGTTGYGFTKKLEKLCIKSTQKSNNGKLYQLVYTNLSWNTSYIVEVINFTPSTSIDSNMIWNYQLQLTGVKPFFISQDQRHKLIMSDIVSSIANKVGYELAEGISKITRADQFFGN